ncbi:MAG: carbohydrate ABC transporter permease [Clostridiaceae bacterium]|nr:carbohydrate ABC transporter permease [Clostridiaceae bacterium]
MLAETRGDKIFDIFINVIMGFILLIYIYPLIFIISASVSDPNTVLRGEMWLFPKGFTLMGYKHILQYKEIWTGYLNTIKIVLLGVPIAMSLTISAGYVLSRKEFKLRNLYMGIFVFTMFFNGGLIPTYLVIKQLNMLDTIWALILPNAITMYYVIIVRTYYNTNIPEELHEAGVIDGCSDIRFLTSVALPLAKPITAVMALFYMVDRWNMYFRPLIYLSDRKLYPLQLILREIVASSNMTPEMLEGFEPSEYAIMVQISNLMKYGVLIVASLPVLLIYPFVQKYFVQGIMIGALKG